MVQSRANFVQRSTFQNYEFFTFFHRKKKYSNNAKIIQTNIKKLNFGLFLKKKINSKVCDLLFIRVLQFQIFSQNDDFFSAYVSIHFFQECLSLVSISLHRLNQ
jgi:hypothetical protein